MQGRNTSDCTGVVSKGIDRFSGMVYTRRNK